jgi:hypothetical protein
MDTLYEPVEYCGDTGHTRIYSAVVRDLFSFSGPSGLIHLAKTAMLLRSFMTVVGRICPPLNAANTSLHSGHSLQRLFI